MIVSLWCPRLASTARHQRRKGCSGHRPIARRRQTKQERVRPQGKKRQRARRPKPAVFEVKFVRDGERFIAALLNDFNIAYLAQYQVNWIETDLTGRGKTRFRPDFYLTDFDTFLEVFEGKNQLGRDRKQSKIDAAARAGKTVILIDLAVLGELTELKNQAAASGDNCELQTHLFNLVSPGLALLAA